MMLERWRRRRSENEVAARLYERLVEQARRPGFFRDLQIPDSLDGRFEMIALHVFLVLHRLKASGADTRTLAQALHDHFFADMDRCLREMGAGDLGVGKRVKRMAEGLYGRIPAYEAALGDDDAAAAALRRNLFGTLPVATGRERSGHGWLSPRSSCSLGGAGNGSAAGRRDQLPASGVLFGRRDERPRLISRWRPCQRRARPQRH